MRILSLDPGKQTGYALIDVEFNGTSVATPQLVDCGTFPGDASLAALQVLLTNHPDRVIIECVDLRDSDIPVFMAGFLSALCIRGGLRIFMSPPKVKTRWLDSASRILSSFGRPLTYYQLEHVKDAIAHVISYIRSGAIDNE